MAGLIADEILEEAFEKTEESFNPVVAARKAALDYVEDETLHGLHKIPVIDHILNVGGEVGEQAGRLEKDVLDTGKGVLVDQKIPEETKADFEKMGEQAKEQKLKLQDKLDKKFGIKDLDVEKKLREIRYEPSPDEVKYNVDYADKLKQISKINTLIDQYEATGKEAPEQLLHDREVLMEHGKLSQLEKQQFRAFHEHFNPSFEDIAKKAELSSNEKAKIMNHLQVGINNDTSIDVLDRQQIPEIIKRHRGFKVDGLKFNNEGKLVYTEKKPGSMENNKKVIEEFIKRKYPALKERILTDGEILKIEPEEGKKYDYSFSGTASKFQDKLSDERFNISKKYVEPKPKSIDDTFIDPESPFKESLRKLETGEMEVKEPEGSFSKEPKGSLEEEPIELKKIRIKKMLPNYQPVETEFSDSFKNKMEIYRKDVPDKKFLTVKNLGRSYKNLEAITNQAGFNEMEGEKLLDDVYTKNIKNLKSVKTQEEFFDFYEDVVKEFRENPKIDEFYKKPVENKEQAEKVLLNPIKNFIIDTGLDDNLADEILSSYELELDGIDFESEKITNKDLIDALPEIQKSIESGKPQSLQIGELESLKKKPEISLKKEPEGSLKFDEIKKDFKEDQQLEKAEKIEKSVKQLSKDLPSALKEPEGSLKETTETTETKNILTNIEKMDEDELLKQIEDSNEIPEGEKQEVEELVKDAKETGSYDKLKAWFKEHPKTGKFLSVMGTIAGGAAGGGITLGISKLKELVDGSDLSPETKKFIKDILDKANKAGQKFTETQLKELEKDLLGVQKSYGRVQQSKDDRDQALSVVNNPSFSGSRRNVNRRNLRDTEAQLKNDEIQLKKDTQNLGKKVDNMVRQNEKKERKEVLKETSKKEMEDREKKALDDGILKQKYPAFNININTDASNNKVASPGNNITKSKKISKIKTIPNNY